MKKLKLVPLSLLFFCIKTFSQIGINTTAPAATLDIAAKNATGASTNTDGLVIPRIDRLRAQSMTGMTTSTLIYVNNISTGTAAGTAANINSVGFYYYDGTLWAKLDTVGDTTIDAFVNDPANTMVKLGTNADGSTARTAGTDFVVKDTGFVGIGTANPTTKLQVVASAIGTGFSLQDGSQGNGKVLSSNANGNASWVTNVSTTPTVLGNLPTSGLSMPNFSTIYYTQANITLPPGRWILSTGTVLTVGSPITLDGQIWCHIYVSDSSFNYIPSSSLVAGAATAGAGSVGRGEVYGMAIGNFIIDNNSGASKTFYIWMDSQNLGATLSQRINGPFGSTAWERWLFANPIN